MPLTRFFGREPEIAELLTLLTPQEETYRPRLVTLTGSGGSGKTRLAIETMRRIAVSSLFYVGFASLADLSEPQQIFSAVADAFFPSAGHILDAVFKEPLETLSALLAAYPAALLILDNFEPLLPVNGAQSVQMLLQHIPGLTCLITSRQLLGIAGEREIPVSPLSVPSQSEDLPRLMQVASVQLWTDRAQAARPDFQVTRRNAHSVAALCRRLEGLPLALELAASWAQTLTPAQMLTRLDQRLNFLVSRHYDATLRHRSMRAVLDGSYERLTPPLRRFFAALSVFRGGWTLEATERVCQNEAALEFLTRLRDSSLVSAEEVGEEMRFRMLETVREYDAEQLAPVLQEDLARKHTDYFVELAERAELEMRGPSQEAWQVRLEAEQENLRALLDQPANLSEAALRIAGALGHYWLMRGQWSEGREWLRKAMQLSNASSVLRAKACCAAAALAWAQDAYREATALAEQGLQLYEEQADAGGSAYALVLLGTVSMRQGEIARAQTQLEESLQRFRQIADTWGIAYTLDKLAMAARETGDYSRAWRLHEESLALWRARKDLQGVAISLSSLGDIALLQEETPTAERLHTDSLNRFRALENKTGVAYAIGKLGVLALRRGDRVQAQDLCRQSLMLFCEVGDRRRMAECLEQIAQIFQSEANYGKTVFLIGAAHHLRECIGAPLPAAETGARERRLAAVRTVLGEQNFNAAWRAGQTADVQDILTDLLQ